MVKLGHMLTLGMSTIKKKVRFSTHTSKAPAYYCSTTCCSTTAAQFCHIHRGWLMHAHPHMAAWPYLKGSAAMCNDTWLHPICKDAHASVHKVINKRTQQRLLMLSCNNITATTSLSTLIIFHNFPWQYRSK